jgi:hypothetical protein
MLIDNPRARRESTWALARPWRWLRRTTRLEEAAGYLADELRIEVPINAYPTKASFVEALRFTRSMTTAVNVLSELGGDGEALILYDTSLPFGVMRVAEHFGVSGDKIDRIRQIHDTHALRTAVGAPRPA